MKRTKYLLIPLLLIILSGCTVRYNPAIRGRVHISVPVNEVIRVFEPDRGEGGLYGLNDSLQFRILTSRSGYITLTAIDPDGTVYEIQRNIYVEAGRMNYSQVFYFVPPRGRHTIRASFTSTPTDVTRVNYVGIHGTQMWTSTITSDIEYSDVRDVAETWLFLE